MLRNLFKVMEEISSKRLKTAGPLIGTHNGHFHADEALAVYLLRLLPTYNPSTLLRTRDPSLLSTCHTVVDVGGEYDPPTNRYDHHQRTFTTTFPDRKTKLSSAGLVYLHFGRPIISQRTSLPETSPEVSLLHDKLYADFVEALDAHDNGISVYDPASTTDLHKRFNDNGVTLGSLVNDLNNNWSSKTPPANATSNNSTNGSAEAPAKTAEQTQADEDARFLEASTLMGTTFLRKLDYYHRAWLPARTLVHSAYHKRRKHDSSGQIMVFPNGSVPWKDHLYALETENTSEPKVLFVLYPEGPHEGAKWRAQAVSVSRDSFESRKPLKEEWRGVRDEALDALSGINGCVFVHASGFIGGNKSFEGAMEMARRSIEA